MPQATPLSPDARTQALPPLLAAGWHMAPEGRDALMIEVKFADFSQAWAAMSRIALCCEAMDHHPEWANVYNRLSITLTTHSCNGLSQLDIDLAQSITRLVDEQHGKVQPPAPAR